MRYPKTDCQLRGEIIREGGQSAIDRIESRLDRDSIIDRREYRGCLEDAAIKFGVDRCEEIPSARRSGVLPYGPA